MYDSFLSTPKYHIFLRFAIDLAEVRIIRAKLQTIMVEYVYIYKIYTDYWSYRHVLLYFVFI